MTKLLENPLVIAGLVGVLLLLTVLLKKLRGAGGLSVDRSPKGLEKLVAQGRYAEAGALAMRHARWGEAMDLFLRAQDPARAAQMAGQMGNHRAAAELYEKAGERDKAARSYESAGMSQRARELSAEPEAKRREEAEARTDPEDSQSPGDPLSRATEAERGFRRAMAEALGDATKKGDAQTLASRASEDFLALGDIARSAAIYRDAEMYDEAIHLYVNVLGQPGEAAPLVALCGHHERAAELYELAGHSERAASVWADVARKSPNPEGFLDRVEALSREVALGLLQELSLTRPLCEKNAELYYRYAEVLERSGERALAAKTFRAMRDLLGGYLDVGTRIAALSEASTAVLRDTVKDPPQEPRESPQGSTEVVVLLDREDLHEEAAAMTREAAHASVSRMRKSSIPPPNDDTEVQRVVFDLRGTRAVRSMASGLEDGPMDIGALCDKAVKAARDGPSIAALRRYISGRKCSLPNVEVYHRLGLACLAAGDWNAALEAFRAVEQASPGYRDAEVKVIEIERWQKMLGSKVSLVGRAPTAADLTAGRYQLRGELGRGGMAVVYRAVDSVLGREVALKFLAEQFCAQKDMQDMFQREARSVGQLNHPNIVTIYDFGVLGGRAFIAMEYVQGHTLDQMLETNGKIPVIEALRVIKQVLDALEYAHARQIIHRDVKPSNMMRSAEGAVKLMDFGLAKSLEDGAKSSMVAGTPGYMPPEQIKGELVDQRADLFAVGASLYEMLTGQLPFAGIDRAQRPRGARELSPAVPELVERMIFTALDTEVSRRFQSAGEFLTPVRRVLAAVDRVASGAAKPRAVGKSAPVEQAPGPDGLNLGPHRVSVPRSPPIGSFSDYLDPEDKVSPGAPEPVGVPKK